MKVILGERSFDIMCITESKHSDDHPMTEIHEGYKWIGKNRSTNGGGEIGFLVNNHTISVIDDNLQGAKSDEFEWLWISAKTEDTQLAIGVTYFPQDIKVCQEEVTQVHN